MINIIDPRERCSCFYFQEQASLRSMLLTYYLLLWCFLDVLLQFLSLWPFFGFCFALFSPVVSPRKGIGFNPWSFKVIPRILFCAPVLVNQNESWLTSLTPQNVAPVSIFRNNILWGQCYSHNTDFNQHFSLLFGFVFFWLVFCLFSLVGPPWKELQP